MSTNVPNFNATTKASTNLFMRINSFSEKTRQNTPRSGVDENQKKRIVSLPTLYNTPSIDIPTLKRSILAYYPTAQGSYLDSVLNSTKESQVHSTSLVPNFQIPSSKVPENFFIFTPQEQQAIQQDDMRYNPEMGAYERKVFPSSTPSKIETFLLAKTLDELTNSSDNNIKNLYQSHFMALHELGRQLYTDNIEKSSLQFKIVRFLENQTEILLKKNEELQSNYKVTDADLADSKTKLLEKDNIIESLRSELSHLRDTIEKQKDELQSFQKQANEQEKIQMIGRCLVNSRTLEELKNAAKDGNQKFFQKVDELSQKVKLSSNQSMLQSKKPNSRSYRIKLEEKDSKPKHHHSHTVRIEDEDTVHVTADRKQGRYLSIYSSLVNILSSMKKLKGILRKVFGAKLDMDIDGIYLDNYIQDECTLDLLEKLSKQANDVIYEPVEFLNTFANSFKPVQERISVTIKLPEYKGDRIRIVLQSQITAHIVDTNEQQNLLENIKAAKNVTGFDENFEFEGASEKAKYVKQKPTASNSSALEKEIMQWKEKYTKLEDVVKKEKALLNQEIQKLKDQLAKPTFNGAVVSTGKDVEVQATPFRYKKKPDLRRDDFYRIGNEKLKQIFEQLKERDDISHKSSLWLLKFISHSYRARTFIESPDISFPEFLFEHIRQLYGHQKLVEEYMASILISLVKFKTSDYRFLMFSYFLTEEWDLQTCNKFFKLWKVMEDCHVGPEYSDRLIDDFHHSSYISKIRILVVLTNLKQELDMIFNYILLLLEEHFEFADNHQFEKAMHNSGFRIKSATSFMIKDEWGIDEALARQIIPKSKFYYIVGSILHLYFNNQLSLSSLEELSQLLFGDKFQQTMENKS